MTRPRRLALMLTALWLLPVADAPAEAPPSDRPRLWAVVVGIDDYPDARIPGTAGAAADARDLGRWLTRTAGWPSGNVLRLDATGPKTPGPADRDVDRLYASRANLDWALNTWLPAKLRPGDVALLAWFGQAATVPDADPSRPHRTRLLPLDARAADLNATGWAAEDALDAVAKTGRNPVLAWLDCGPAGRGRPVLPDDPDPDAGRRWAATLCRWPGVAAWLAADRGVAAEGTFVKALTEALGTAERPRNLVATADALAGTPALSRQGFRAGGSLSPDLSVWPRDLAAAAARPPELLIQQGHADRVFEVLVAPGGAEAVSAGADSTVKVWRLADRTLLRTLSDHTVGVTALALSPDGRRVVSGDGTGRVWAWNLPAFGLLTPRVARAHRAGIVRIAFLADGKTCATLDADGVVAAWDVSGTEAVPSPVVRGANALACTDDRLVIASANPGGGASVVRAFDAAGRPTGEWAGPGGLVAAHGLVARGPLVAAGDRDGRVLVRDVTDGRGVSRFDVAGNVEAVAFVGHRLAVAFGSSVRLRQIAAAGPGETLDAGAAVERLAASADGRQLAALTEQGRVSVWDVPETGAAAPRRIEGSESAVLASVAFGPDGRTLVGGGQGGEVRTWDLPAGLQRPPTRADRNQLTGLALSPDGRDLVVVTRDGAGWFWNLAEARTLRRIAGSWNACAFFPDGARLALTGTDGDVAVVDARTGDRKVLKFERPTLPGGRGVSRAAFRKVAVSPDGTRVAAAATNTDLACVWDAATGRLTRTLRAHPEGLSALGFTADGRLLTAGPDGTAALRAADGDGAPAFQVPEGDNPVTAAAADPLGGGILTGHADGQVLRWTPEPGGPPRSTRLDRHDGAVLSLAVTPDGAWLAAGGDDKALRLVSLRPGDRQAFRLLPRHDERVTGVVAGAVGGVIATASEDTTVRLWRVGDRKPLGTLAAVGSAGEWVAFDPEGYFDSAPGAEARVTWLRDGKVQPLDQFFERFRVFRLADRLRRGEEPPRTTFRYEPGPALALDPAPVATGRRELEVAVTLGESDVTDLRLYLNGVPVADAEAFRPTDPARPARRVARVALRHGSNRLVAMAGRPAPGAIEGRSNEVEIRCDAPERPGRLHVVALGVNAYRNQPLKFAKADAEAVARFLGDHPADAGTEPGEVVVLTNRDVTAEAVGKALLKVRAAARPEDTVALFVAGHTDVRLDRAGRDQFCLLLPEFPMPPLEPGRLLAMRGPWNAFRGPDDPASVLPYASIYRYLLRLPALQRLVILDACQAESVRDDPAVRRLQDSVDEKLDAAAHAARTTYLAAGRRNVPAFESDALGHGVFTHVVLSGLGATGLSIPPGPGGPIPNADLDHDGRVTTAELRAHADRHLPALAARLAPDLPTRGPEPPATPRPLRLEAADDAVFPVTRLP